MKLLAIVIQVERAFTAALYSPKQAMHGEGEKKRLHRSGTQAKFTQEV